MLLTCKKCIRIEESEDLPSPDVGEVEVASVVVDATSVRKVSHDELDVSNGSFSLGKCSLFENKLRYLEAKTCSTIYKQKTRHLSSAK